MPTTDPITTDRLAAAIREGMATQPLLTRHARPVADRLAALIRKRLPNITAADTGELMIHLAAYLSTEIAALSSAGETPQSAILVATSGAAVAGVELYDNGEQPPATPLSDAPDEAPYAAARLRAWFEDTEGPMVMDEADFDDVLTVLTAYERTVATPPTAEQDARETEGTR